MIQDVMVAEIEGNETLLQTFGRRIYPSVLPDKPGFPAIVYEVVNMPISHTFVGAGTIEEATVRLTVYDESYLKAWTSAGVLRAELDGKAGTWGTTTVGACLLDDLADAPALVAEDEAAVAWGVRLDFSIQFEE